MKKLFIAMHESRLWKKRLLFFLEGTAILIGTIYKGGE